MPVSHFFDRIVRDVVGPIEPPFRVLGITYNYDRDEANVDYVSSPAGPRTATERVIGYSIDRILVIDAIARTARVYSRRIDRATSLPNPVREDWAAELRHDFPGWFDIDMECKAGWSDLIRAMAEWLWELGLPKGFRFVRIKEKFAGLRAYSSGRALSPEILNAVRTRVDAFEAVSLFVCEQCGEPGRPRRRDNFFYAACGKHAHDPIA
jgi:hypothetical protein